MTTPPKDATVPPAERQPLRRFLFSGEGWPYLLVPVIPVAIVLELVHVGSTVVSCPRHWEWSPPQR